MKTLELSLAQIGNSRGIRLPADLIRKHGFEHGLVLEDRGHELALKPKTGPRKLSWEDTARETVAANEDWSEWDCTLADGLDDFPWEGAIPAEVRKWAKECAAKERQQTQRHTKTGRRKGWKGTRSIWGRLDPAEGIQLHRQSASAPNAMSLREKREFVQAQIIETDRLLELTGDHPLMAPALAQRKAEFERELKELPPPAREPRTVLFFAGGGGAGDAWH